MLFRSKTAIKVRFQKQFNTKKKNHLKALKGLKALFNFNGNTQKFSAIITKLSNDYNAEQNDEILSFDKQSQQCLQS